VSRQVVRTLDHRLLMLLALCMRIPLVNIMFLCMYHRIRKIQILEFDLMVESLESLKLS
jgi:hypothetical protein